MLLKRAQPRALRSLLTAAHPSAARQSSRGAVSSSTLHSGASTSLLHPSHSLQEPGSIRQATQSRGHPQHRCFHFGPDHANQPGPSRTQSRKATPLDEITRLRELINRANAINSKLSKERLLAEFDDLIPLLAFLYDPYTRFHVTSSSLHNYLQQRRKDDYWQNNQAPLMSGTSTRSQNKTRAAALRAKQEQDVRERTPSTLLELFQLLASRQITGHEAMAVVRNFLDQHGIIEQHEYTLKAADDPNMTSSELFRRALLRPTSLEIFYRCLDRNLKAGFRGRILRQAVGAETAAQQRTKGIVDKKDKNKPADSLDLIRQSFEVALGRPVSRDDLPSLFAQNDAPAWYASRKLDGVRCLFVVRLQQDGAQWKVSSILALSRTGRPFSTLSVLEKELAQKLPSFPGLADLVGSASSDIDGLPTTATLILDGEVCILRPPEQASPSAIKQLDATLSESTEDVTEQTMVEDFAAVVGLIKRHNFTIHEPAFFPFDLLSLQEFTQWRTSTTRTFSQRLQTLESLVSFFQADARHHRKPDIIRRLSQHLVSSTDQVEDMLATASKRGWEGLVLRQDTPYEGKRTKAIRKFKEWKDAEYTVLTITVATMRLPIDGRFEEREAMASIQIEHRGTRVSVGSGFTPEQRVEFAKDPSRIVGKVVTVEYFDESKTTAGGSARNGGESGGGEKTEVYSLRFPRIKQIWGEERDI